MLSTLSSMSLIKYFTTNFKPVKFFSEYNFYGPNIVNVVHKDGSVTKIGRDYNQGSVFAQGNSRIGAVNLTNNSVTNSSKLLLFL